jgi:WD40 repeat protein
MGQDGRCLFLPKKGSHLTYKTCLALRSVWTCATASPIEVAVYDLMLLLGRLRSDIVSTGSYDGTIRVWDLSDYSIVLQWCVFRGGRFITEPAADGSDVYRCSAGPVAVNAIALDDEVDGSVFGGFSDGFVRCYENSTGVRPVVCILASFRGCIDCSLFP